MMFRIIIATIIIQNTVTIAGVQKRNISQLILLPFTGLKPQFGVGCRLAAQMAIDVVNNRSDILGDYYIQADYADEKLGAAVVGLLTDHFLPTPVTRSPVLQSPIVVGPFLSAGCKAAGPILHHLNAVGLSIACASRDLVNRRFYPNLYLTIGVAEAYGQIAVHFIKQVGHWNKMAIYSYAAALNDYSQALAIRSLASDKGFTIIIFDLLIDIGTEDLEDLKAKDARIIVFFSSMYPLVVKFLCMALQAGITGSRYVFFLHSGIFVDPSSLPREVYPGCSREMLLKQHEISFWISPVVDSNHPEMISQLGYNALEFNDAFSAAIKNKIPPDYENRYLCHDAILVAIFALDRADRRLRSELNLTLSDYNEHPTAVAEYVNASVAESDFVGLRIGKMHFSPDNGMLENDGALLRYWTKENGLQRIFSQDFLKNATTKVGQFTWSGWKDGLKPPKDSASEITHVDHISSEILIAILILTVLQSLGQITAFVLTMLKFLHNVRLAFPRLKMLGYLGCFILNISAVCFVADNESNMYILAHFHIILTTLGLTILHGCISFRCCLLWLNVRELRFSHGPCRFVVSRGHRRSTWSVNRNAVQRSLGNADRNALLAVILVLCCAVACAVGWLIVSKISCSSSTNYYDQPVYDKKDDTFINFLVTICVSADGNSLKWVVAIASIHVCYLLVGIFSIFGLREINRMHSSASLAEILNESNYMTAALVNATTMSVAVILILLLLNGGPPKGQFITLAVGCLVESGITSFLWFVPMVMHIHT